MAMEPNNSAGVKKKGPVNKLKDRGGDAFQ